MNSFPEVRIGIIGLGYVGSAILNSLSDRFIDLVIIDPDKGHNSTYNDLAGAEAVFGNKNLKKEEPKTEE